MNELAQLLGISEDAPEVRRALALAEGDHQFLRTLVSERKRLKLTQSEVAERLGISQASVAAFERYDNDPKLSTIRRYAQVVGLLVAHCVEPDEGQLVGKKPGSAWTPSWQSSGAAELHPSVTTPPRTTEQVMVRSDTVRADLTLAA